MWTAADIPQIFLMHSYPIRRNRRLKNGKIKNCATCTHSTERARRLRLSFCKFCCKVYQHYYIYRYRGLFLRLIIRTRARFFPLYKLQAVVLWVE